MIKRIKELSLGMAVAALLMTGLSAPAFAYTYQITIDTSSLAGQSDNLDIQFNPGDATAPAAQAVVSGFSSDGVLLPPATPTGSVTGNLPGQVTFLNNTAYNDYFEGITLGNTITLDVTFSGAFQTAHSGAESAFAVSLYDSTGINPILTTDPNGSLVTFQLAPGGGVTYSTFPAGTGLPSPTTVSAVPLPPSVALFLTGAAILFFVSQKKSSVRRQLHG